MTTPAANNCNVPDAETNRFTGVYPDNTYPLVEGEPDAEQEKRKQARDEHARTRRIYSDAPRVAHPPLTKLYDTNDHATRTADAEASANA